MKRSQIAQKILDHFLENSWPNAVLISGKQSSQKKAMVLNMLTNELYRNRFDQTQDMKTIELLINEKQHPDLYMFTEKNISIGEDEQNVKKGTTRHLLNHFIPYSPQYSKIRFVYFEDASKIRDQAESALLKVIEEPPLNTHFILSAEDDIVLKKTIISRCFPVPYVEYPKKEDISQEPWERFWYLSGYQDTQEFELANNNDWLVQLKTSYDRFSFSQNDFEIFDSLGVHGIRDSFPSENSEMQTRILFLTFLPLYFSLRDLLIEGKLPSIGPIRIPKMEYEKNYAALIILRGFLSHLRKKYFQTRSVYALPVYYTFLQHLMSFWQFPD